MKYNQNKRIQQVSESTLIIGTDIAKNHFHKMSLLMALTVLWSSVKISDKLKVETIPI